MWEGQNIRESGDHINHGTDASLACCQSLHVTEHWSIY